MPEFLHGADLSDRISKAFANKRSALIAIAYWGRGGGTLLGLTGTLRDVRIVCNLAHGGTDPDEIRALQALGAHVKHIPALHTKIGVVGNSSFLGSSNASDNGLRQDGPPNLYEANVFYAKVRPEIEARAEILWDAAHEVEEADLERALLLRQRRRAALEASHEVLEGADSLVDALVIDPERFDAAPAWFAVYKTPTPEEAEKIDAGNEQAERRNPDGNIECYYDWPNFPREGYVVDIRRPLRQGRWAFDGILRRVRELADFEYEGGTFHPAHVSTELLGFPITSADKSRLRAAAQQYFREFGANENDAVVERLSALVPYLQKSAK